MRTTAVTSIVKRRKTLIVWRQPGREDLEYISGMGEDEKVQEKYSKLLMKQIKKTYFMETE